MRALVTTWLLVLTFAIGANGYLLNRANTREHVHLEATGELAVKAHAATVAIAARQSALDARVTSAMGDHTAEMRRRIDGLCLALEVLAKTHEGRERMPLPVIAVCPRVPQVSGTGTWRSP